MVNYKPMARINNPMRINKTTNGLGITPAVVKGRCWTSRWTRLAAVALGSWLVLEAGPVAAQDLAIKAGRIITVSGPEIENGVILIRDGRIAEVGAGLAIPVDLRVVDASQQVVMPGMVDPHSAAGLSQANERNAVVPFLSVVDGIDPVRSYFEESRRNGVTTAAVVPGNSTMIGGQAAILKTAGSYVDDMLLVRSAGLKISLQPPSGSRMSHLAKLRRELETAKRQLAEKAEKDKKAEAGEVKTEAAEGDKPVEKPAEQALVEGDVASREGEGLQDPPAEGAAPGGGESAEAASAAAANSAMQDLLSGKIRAFVYCQNAADVGQAFRLMDEYQFAAILVLGPECYPAAAEIAKRGATVILDPTLVFWKRDLVTRKEEKIVLPTIYREAGVKFLFQSNNSDSRQSLGSSYFWFQAATAVSYGLSREEALAALTLEPARLLGIDSFVGSIEPGRDADLVILTGDPLDVSTWVETTLVNGEVVYQRADDWKLKLLLEAAPQ